MKPLAARLVRVLKDKKYQIRCVESCTAGALTAALGEVSGVSEVLDRSWVTYSNLAKVEEVGVSAQCIELYGAVSQEVVQAMAEGAVQSCAQDTLAIAITGIAGPAGGTLEKPVGTVWIGLKLPQQSVRSHCFHFQGERNGIQKSAVSHGLSMALQYLEAGEPATG